MDSLREKDEKEFCEPSLSGQQIFREEILPIKYYRLSITKIRLVSEYLGVAVPLLVTVCYTWVKHQKHIIDFLSKHAKLALLSYGGMLHVIRIEALLRLVRVREAAPLQRDKAECVECEVLFDPGPGLRSADVIFIHGIKGALHKTWRQGKWARGTVGLKRLASSSGLSDQPATFHLFQTKSELEDEDDAESQEDLEEIFSRIRDGQEELEERRAGDDPDRGATSDDDGCTSRCWPRDWLPLDCPSARVIAVNYTTDPNLWSPFWSNVPPRTTLPERAWEMIAKLTVIGVGHHPIVWVGHSKGGLYIKQMLVNASQSCDERDRMMCQATKGILFYSVPHRGSRLAKFNILPIILKRSVELTEVQENCEEILNLDRKFKELLDQPENNFLIKSFVETSLTLMFILYVRVVTLESAVNDFGEIYGVELDHRNICKPRNRKCFLYRELVDLIKRCQNLDNLM